MLNKMEMFTFMWVAKLEVIFKLPDIVEAHWRHLALKFLEVSFGSSKLSSTLLAMFPAQISKLYRQTGAGKQRMKL